MRDEGYYYGILSFLEKRAYKILYDGLKAQEVRIVVDLQITFEQLKDIFLKVLYDNPLFFHVNQTVIRRIGEPGHWILWPEYLYDQNETGALTREIRNAAARIAERGKHLSGNEFLLEKYLHDCVVKSIAYDYEALEKKDCFNAHSIVGAFLDKRAVCEGIARAFKFLCDEFGIHCIVVYGKAGRDGDLSRAGHHTWNLVKIRQEPYHVDVTWDNACDRQRQHNAVSYAYFNVTTDEIMRDHLPIGTYPLCTSTRFHMRAIGHYGGNYERNDHLLRGFQYLRL
jgi:hypothetical protein